MNKTLINLSAAAAVILTALVPAAPAFARHRDYDTYENARYDNGQYDRGYDDRGSDRDYRDERGYRDDRGYRCGKGTGGLIIGAVVGGLLGRAVAGRRGDKTTGLIIGAGAGALAGRAIDRSDSRRRC